MDAADAESAEAIKVEDIGRIDFLQLRSVEILCWPFFCLDVKRLTLNVQRFECTKIRNFTNTIKRFLMELSYD